MLQVQDKSLTGVLTVARRLPQMKGAPIRVERVAELRDRRGPVHGGSFLRERRISLSCSSAELARILVHEIFHFVWLRLGNPKRFRWEALLAGEGRERRQGELGWSAEWRKNALRAADWNGRTRAWRLYCCESFCDTAAWLYSGAKRHPEFTLAGKARNSRRRWFVETIETTELSI